MPPGTELGFTIGEVGLGVTLPSLLCVIFMYDDCFTFVTRVKAGNTLKNEF